MRRGYFMQTRSARKFYLRSPSPDDVCIEDIAHALSQICRFTGHTSEFYSVAEHCVHVSRLVQPHHALWGLLHDAPEAYIGDISWPLKKELGDSIGVIEYGVEQVVQAAFGVMVDSEAKRDVGRADVMMLSVEARELLAVTDFEAAGWAYYTEPDPNILIHRWSPADAHREFLTRFTELLLAARTAA